MTVLAHFYVKSVKDMVNGQHEVELGASTKGPHDWSQYTPAGDITLRTVNDSAAEWYRDFIGKDIEVEFREIKSAGEAAQ